MENRLLSKIKEYEEKIPSDAFFKVEINKTEDLVEIIVKITSKNFNVVLRERGPCDISCVENVKLKLDEAIEKWHKTRFLEK